MVTIREVSEKSPSLQFPPSFVPRIGQPPISRKSGRATEIPAASKFAKIDRKIIIEFFHHVWCRKRVFYFIYIISFRFLYIIEHTTRSGMCSWGRLSPSGFLVLMRSHCSIEMKIVHRLIVYAYIQMISVHRSIVYIHVSSVRRLVASIQVSSVCQSIFYIQVNSVHRLVASIQVSSACSQIGCFNLGVNWDFFLQNLTRRVVF